MQDKQLQQEKGFTLIELLLTMFILSLLAGLIGPRIIDFDAYEQRSFFAELLSAGQHAQKRAIGSQCPVELKIDGNSFALLQAADCQLTSAHDQAVPDPAYPKQAYQKDAPASITLANTTVRFDALGQSRNASNQVSDFSIAVGTRTITIDGQTGWSRQAP